MMLKKKTIVKFLLCAILAIVIMCGSFVAGAVATPSRPQPQNPRVTWYKLNKLGGITKDADRFTIKTTVIGKTFKLYLSFPQEGGFRLYSDIEGYFQPKKTEKIRYSGSDDKLTLTAGGDTKVVFRKKNDNWSLDIYDGKQLVNRVTGKQLAIGYGNDKKPAKARFEGTVGAKETFTGLGGQFDTITKNGTSSLLWNLDVLQEINGRVKRENNVTYTNVPLLHSTNGYSVFFNNSYAIMADIAKSNAKKYTLEAYGPTMDFYFFTGKTDERLNDYCKLTGYNILPPKWAYSYWAGNSAVYWQNESGGAYLTELQKMMDGYKQIGTPIKSMFVEGVIYKDPKVHSLLKKTGTRAIAWHDSGYYDRPNDALPGYTADQLPTLKSYYNPQTGDLSARYYDFTSPLIGEVLEYAYGKYLDYGTKGAMIDFADAVPDDTIFYNGKLGSEMHNIYSYFYQKSFKELYEKHHGDDYFLFARAGYAGSQSLMGKFLGDAGCTFEGLKNALTEALNLSMCGFSNWGSDMGGLGVEGSSRPSEDTYRRWVQWSAFNPIMRSHGHTTRTPWSYSESAVREFQKYYWLRENLMDTIYSTAIAGTMSGKLIATPLTLAFPSQSKLNRVEGEYMFCGDILVDPIVTADALSKQTVLPNGNWTNFWTGQNVKGGQTVVTRASEGTLPLYLRASSVLPIQLPENLKLGSNMEEGKIPALLIAPATGRRTTTFYKEDKSAVKFTSEKKANGNTTISVNGDWKTQAVVAKGISASSVMVDGEKLTELSTATAYGSIGYAVDHVNNTTTIVLPENWKNLSLVNGGGITKNLAAGMTVISNADASGNAASNLTDGDDSNYFTLSKSQTYIEVDLGEVKNIREIQMTWGMNYASGYAVEASEDGENWFLIYETDAGTGDEETVTLDSMTSARYLRFSDFVNAQRAPAVLSSIRVYGDEMSYLGLCDITGEKSADVSINAEDEYENEYEDEYEDGDDDGQKVKKRQKSKTSPSTWLKKIIRRRRAGGSFPWLWVIIAIAVLVVAVGGLIWLILFKRKKKKTANEENNLPQKE